MTQAGRSFHPVIVTIPGSETDEEQARYAGVYEIHKGKPDHPRVYRRVGARAAEGRGHLIRVREDDAARLRMVLRFFREGVDRHKAETAARKEAQRLRKAELERKRAWRNRRRALGAIFARLWRLTGIPRLRRRLDRLSS